MSDELVATVNAVQPYDRTKNLKNFPKGKSGNPSGRPKSLPGFRVKCRNLSLEILREIKARMSDPEVPLVDLVKAFEAVADRGGFLSLDKEEQLQVAKYRAVLAALAMDGLKDEARKALVASLNE